jgi:hypothetical protein
MKQRFETVRKVVAQRIVLTRGGYLVLLGKVFSFDGDWGHEFS